jgi:polar amino acid transport system permease protein
MNIQDTLLTLATWTPYLLSGFGWNVLIALTAMVMGTALGSCLAWMRLSKSRLAARISGVVTELSRNIPTIVFQFYLAVMLPNQWLLPGTTWVIDIPGWVKASMALSVAVVGFTSDNFRTAISEWRQGRHSTALLFLPSWTSYLLIIVIASSTASIIGVSELVSRCNTVVNAIGDTRLLIPFYLYASFFFLLVCYPLTLVMTRIKANMAARWVTALPK